MSNTLTRTLLVISLAIPFASDQAKADGAAGCNPGDFPATCPTKDDYNEAISQFDLANTISLGGHVARIHYTITAPGGVIGQHSHTNRPCFEYMLEGEAFETRQTPEGKVIATKVKKGDVVSETSGVTHWWKNESQTTARIIAVDIFADAAPTFCQCQSTARTSPFVPPTNPDNIKIENLGEIELGKEYPGVAAVKDYVMRSRRLTLLPHQTMALQNSKGRPAYTYIVQGSPVENRSDQEPSSRRPEEVSIANGDISFFWQNPTSEPVILWAVDFVPKNGRQ